MKSQAEWQEFFDENFPEGALVTPVKTGELAAGYDDSPQWITGKFVVFDVEDDNPQVSFFLVGTTRELRISFDSFEEREYGFYAKTTEEEAPSFILSRRLADWQRQAIQQDSL